MPNGTLAPGKVCPGPPVPMRGSTISAGVATPCVLACPFPGGREAATASMTGRPYRIGRRFMNGPRLGCGSLRKGGVLHDIAAVSSRGPEAAGSGANITRHRACGRGKFLRRCELSTCVHKLTLFSIVTLVRRGQIMTILHRSYAPLKTVAPEPCNYKSGGKGSPKRKLCQRYISTVRCVCHDRTGEWGRVPAPGDIPDCGTLCKVFTKTDP